MDEFFKYLPAALVVCYFFYKKLKQTRVKVDLPELLAAGAVVVDVRTQSEYERRHGDRSINIPLDDLPKRLSELDKSKPVVLCCASGARSQKALKALSEAGFTKLFNIGPWTNAG